MLDFNLLIDSRIVINYLWRLETQVIGLNRNPQGLPVYGGGFANIAAILSPYLLPTTATPKEPIIEWLQVLFIGFYNLYHQMLSLNIGLIV